jgi:GntR family transcriptional regulator
VSVSGPRSVLEAETRTLGVADPHITGQVAANPTGAAYLPPEQMQPAPMGTFGNDVSPKHTRRNILIFTAVAVLILLPLLAGAGFLYLRRVALRTAARIAAPGGGGIGGGRGGIGVAGRADIETPRDPADSTLIYPGGEILLQTGAGSGRSIIQLRTHDSFDKVFDWYNAKLKPGKVFKSPPNNAVLKTDNSMAIITAQLERSIHFAVVTGKLRVGEQLPTVRQLAVELSINANTVAKVYAELERDGIVETRRGVGTFVSERPAEASSRRDRDRQLRELVDHFIAETATRGFSLDDLIEHLEGRRKKVTQGAGLR